MHGKKLHFCEVAPLVMHKIQIRIDASRIQRLTAAPKMSFSGAYHCRNVSSCAPVGQTVSGPVHPGKDGNDFSPIPAGEPFSLFLYRRDGLFKTTEIMRSLRACGIFFTVCRSSASLKALSKLSLPL